MEQAQTYETLLETSRRVNWRVDDLIGADRRLDFSRPFLPEAFAQTAPLDFLSPAEKLKLNHVRARGYLAMFELVETFVVPFVSGQAQEKPGDDPFKAAALRQFVREENKHRELFRRFLAEFDAGFGVECGLIGPAEDIAAAILAHGEMGVTIAVLGLEWMSQGHYLESVRGDRALDPQFRRLLEHHWMEEAQHARLDGLMLRAMAETASPAEIDRAVDDYFEIGAFFDAGFEQQAQLDLDAFQRAAGRTLADEERRRFLRVQHQALRWTFLGTAMLDESFLEEVGALGSSVRARIEAAAQAFTLH